MTTTSKARGEQHPPKAKRDNTTDYNQVMAQNNYKMPFRQNLPESMKHLVSQIGGNSTRVISKNNSGTHDRETDKTAKKFNRLMKRV